MHEASAGPEAGKTFPKAAISEKKPVSVAARKTPEAPILVDGFRIRKKIGEGGMGVVWKAEQLSTNRLVALKVMSAASFGSDRARHRFEREVELTAKLEHPHIARLYESGLRKGVCFYAMEFIDGQHLDAYVINHALNRRQIIELMQVICRAVQYAHQKGIIHRDLKPSNIMVDKEGQPHVMDFGLAKAIEGDIAVSIDGEAAGTPIYMSPEQAAGKSTIWIRDPMCIRSAVILFRLLTGQFPHDSSGPASTVMWRIAEEEPKRLKLIEPKADSGIGMCCFPKPCQKESERRYATAGEPADDIDHYLNNELLTAKAPTISYLVVKRLKKHRKRLMLAAVICCLVILVGIVAESQHREALKQKQLHDSSSLEVTKAQAESEQTSLGVMQLAITSQDQDTIPKLLAVHGDPRTQRLLPPLRPIPKTSWEKI